MIRSCQNNIVFSESGALNLWSCSFIETRRNIWQNMFWGIAGSFDWEIENLPENMKNFSIYGRVREFFDGVNLEGEGWHSGMVKLDNQDKWKFKQSYLNDCIREDESADVVYLRSGNTNNTKAMGVITNRRANYFTLGGQYSCKDVNGETNPIPTHSSEPPYDYSLQNYGPVSSDINGQELRLRNIGSSFQEFKIKYYSPYDQNNPLKEDTKWGPKLTLEFPEMDTLDIMLFEVYPVGGNFKNLSGNSASEDSLQETVNRSNDAVRVYPNPSPGEFNIVIDKPADVSEITIFTDFGKKINVRNNVQRENIYYLDTLKPGVYILRIEYHDKVLSKKLVIH